MRRLLRWLRGALGMGLLWAVGGAMIGGLIELLMNLLPGPDTWGSIDMWPQALAVPGFFGGIIFSVVLGVVARGRKFDDLSVGKFALWGGLGAAVVMGGLLTIGLGRVELPDLLMRIVVFVLPPTLFSAVMSSGSLWVAKLAEARMVGSGTDRRGLSEPHE